MKIQKNNPVLNPSRAEFNQHLKPCPFCGKKARLTNRLADSYTVECTSCLGQNEGDTIGGDGVVADHRIAMADAVEQWNTRA
ncbi:Lar family restriction alleviation protein [Hymenobacter saemangeumensis]|uniref:Lar family restriction alleviation protein n=1 Tax=Hymenobacter saemangeumensis TaxID=1084522 RepID=UPI0031ECB913